MGRRQDRAETIKKLDEEILRWVVSQSKCSERQQAEWDEHHRKIMELQQKRREFENADTHI